MEKLLTIVIPSYNTEKYIDYCLPSFFIEPILNEIEILIINDGSSDKTLEIAKNYQKKFPSTIRVIDKPNGGHGSVINRGIQEATGKYFKIVDGDDWVNKQGLTNLIEYLRLADVDMIVNPYIKVNDKNGKQKKVREKYFDKYNSEKIYQFDSLELNNVIPMHEITYKTSLLKNNHIEVDEGIFYVDAEYILYPIKYIKTIAFLNSYLYMYRINSNTQSINIKSAQKNILHHKQVVESTLNYFNSIKNSLSLNKKNYMMKHIHTIVDTQYHILMSFKPTPIIKNSLIEWNLEVKELNKNIYNMKADLLVESLKKHNFKNYKFIIELNRLRLAINKLINNFL